jgi:hypothetical protein
LFADAERHLDIALEPHGLWRGAVLQSGAAGQHIFGLLKEIDSPATITCGQLVLGIFQQGIVMVYAGSRANRLD